MFQNALLPCRDQPYKGGFLVASQPVLPMRTDPPLQGRSDLNGRTPTTNTFSVRVGSCQLVLLPFFRRKKGKRASSLPLKKAAKRAAFLSSGQAWLICRSKLVLRRSSLREEIIFLRFYRKNIKKFIPNGGNPAGISFFSSD